MKKFIRIITVIAACLICLASCSVKFEYADNQLINKKTNDRYNPLPIGFEPCGVGEAYGKFGEFILYEMTDLNGNKADPELWVTEEYAGSATTVFLNESVPLPSFSEMEFDVFYICEEDQSVISVATVDSKEEISELVSSLKENDSVLWMKNDIISFYTVKLYSEEYPTVFYSLDYYIAESGNYLYDRANDVCVDVGDMLSEYVSEENE